MLSVGRAVVGGFTWVPMWGEEPVKLAALLPLTRGVTPINSSGYGNSWVHSPRAS
jgi:hypothetical protein